MHKRGEKLLINLTNHTSKMRKISFKKSVTAALLSVLFFGGISAACGNTPEGNLIAFVFSLLWLSFVFATSLLGVRIPGLGTDNLNIEDTSWSGPALEYMITRAVTDADTVLKGVACVLEEISRKTITIPRLEVTVLMQAYTPTPTALGNTVVDGRQLPLQKFEFYDEFNPQDYEQHFFEQDFEEGKLIDETLPPTAENFTMLQYMKRLNKWFEDSFWNSRLAWNPTGTNVAPISKGYSDNTLQSGTNYYFNGLVFEALSDSTVQTLAYNPTNFLPANIRGNVFTPMYNTLINNPISKALAYKYGKTGLRYLISYGDQANYEEALRTDQFKNIDSTETAQNRYRGYDLVPLAGLDEGTVFLSICRPDYASNFYIGTNTTDDITLEMKKLPYPSDLFGVKGIFKMATIHGYGDQMVLCTPITL